MREAARPAAARAQRCTDDVASEEDEEEDEVAMPPASSPSAAATATFAFAFGAALGTPARCGGADFDAPGNVGLVPWLAARMRMVAELETGR